MKILNQSVTLLISLICGFSLMAAEILGSRLLTPYFGNSAYMWGALISVFLAGLCIGYLLGGLFSDIRKSFLDVGCFTLLSGIYMLISSIVGRNLAMNLAMTNLDNRLSLMITALFLYFLPCILIGMIQPYLVAILSDMTNKAGKSSGMIYLFSTIGSIVGVLTTSFIFINLFGTETNIKIAVAPLFAASFISFLSATQKKAHT